ncbi:MAG: DUF1236 domain-containing protein [Xanthobacteraceae bacterium]
MKRTTIALAAAMLLSGVAAVSAGAMSQSSQQSSQSTMARPASDTLSLSSAQRKAAWNDLRSEAAKQTAPPGFKDSVGALLPTTLKIEPIPDKVASAIPALRPYDFAMVHGKLFIVNPSDKKIVEVITD